jgi:hypothetical protein
VSDQSDENTLGATGTTRELEKIMMDEDPLNLSKDALEEIMTKISLAESPVGIDAKYTHAIIITYLQQISARLDKIESRQ